MLHQKGGGADVLRMSSMLQGWPHLHRFLRPCLSSDGWHSVDSKWLAHHAWGMLISESWELDLITVSYLANFHFCMYLLWLHGAGGWMLCLILEVLTAEVRPARAASLCA